MKSNKHDHKATKKLKACIFAIMLLLPFLMIVPTAFYYGFNEQAQAQTRQEQVTLNTSDINYRYDIEELETYTLYQFELGYSQDTEIDFQYLEVAYWYSDDLEMTISNNNSYKLIINDSYYVVQTPNKEIGGSGSGITINCSFNDLTQLNYLYSEDLIEIYTIYGCNEIVHIGEYVEYTMSITDSMATAWNNTWTNPVFSWTNNSPFYTAMSNFTNVFGIENMQIANLLTYIATITAIYIVFDIVIELFTYLTHLIPKSD
jgi:hypothetical protein